MVRFLPIVAAVMLVTGCSKSEKKAEAVSAATSAALDSVGAGALEVFCA